MEIDVSGINAIITFICIKLNTINDKDSLLDFFNSINKKINIEEEHDFFDFPVSNLPSIKEKGNISYLYILSFTEIDHYQKLRIAYKMMYIDTINGPWIAINLSDMNTINTIVTFLWEFSSNDGVIFKHKHYESYIKFKYYKEINKFFLLICGNKNMFDHPWYAHNKIIKHMGDEENMNFLKLL
jgi:hypothetical protein